MRFKRREVIFLLGGAALWPLPLRAQQTKRIGYVTGIVEDAEGQARFGAFREGLKSFGWIEGQNIELIARYGAADPDRNRTYVAEFVKLMPDVVVTSNPPSISALMKEAPTLPIVFPIQSDPVALGFVDSFARPSRNVTGFTLFEPSIAGKWLELLRELAPSATRVAVLVDPRIASAALYIRTVEAAASTMGIQVIVARVRSDAEIEQAIDAFARTPNGALIVPPGPGVENRRSLIFRLAVRHRLPAIYPFRYIAEEGGLISYGPDVLDLFRRSASYVDRILKGEKAGELPVQFPIKFELVINLKTAKELGVTVPLFLEQRADKVIE